jgi:hypothetical protein
LDKGLAGVANLTGGLPPNDKSAIFAFRTPPLPKLVSG